MKPHKKLITKRFTQTMTPTHFLANILHPRYRGRKLSPENIEKAQSLLLEINPEMIGELLQIITNSDKIPMSLKHETTVASTEPNVWWLSVQRSGAIPEDLCTLALKLLAMPASSGGLERVFSNFGMIQTKLRNRLGVEKATKLVFCYRMLKSAGEIDW